METRFESQNESKSIEEIRIEDGEELTFDTLRHKTTQLDHNGLPLIPQPTVSPYDPLNYPNVRLRPFE